MVRPEGTWEDDDGMVLQGALPPAVKRPPIPPYLAERLVYPDGTPVEIRMIMSLMHQETRTDDGTSIIEQWILDSRELLLSEYLALPITTE